MNKLDNLLIKPLENTVKEFGKDELAFLALTTKIELPLRDRLAYVLHKKLSKQNFIVSREWYRVDLAILKDNKPKVLVELKAMYTFDAVNENGYYKSAIVYLKDDMNRRRQSLADKDTNIFGILLATHPKKRIPSKLRGVVKYQQGINGAFKKFSNEKEVFNVANKRVDKFIGKNKIIKKGVLKGGSAFGIETDVLYWIIK